IDPLFNEDYSLQANSLAINKGSNALYVDLDVSSKDIAGNARVYNYATGGTIDMGAYEIPNSVAPILSGFTNISKTYGDSGFTLTAPTSNSEGTFTYSSSDESVVTISGNTVTIVGAGTATITATQAATANYNSGSISLTVT